MWLSLTSCSIIQYVWYCNGNFFFFRGESDNTPFVAISNKATLKEEKEINMESIYTNHYDNMSSPSRFEHSLFSYPNERSPDSTTKNICRICGKT